MGFFGELDLMSRKFEIVNPILNTTSQIRKKTLFNELCVHYEVRNVFYESAVLYPTMSGFLSFEQKLIHLPSVYWLTHLSSICS